MMAATFVQMVAFMLYKIFAQERLEDQSYVQNLMSQSRQHEENECRIAEISAFIGNGR